MSPCITIVDDFQVCALQSCPFEHVSEACQFYIRSYALQGSKSLRAKGEKSGCSAQGGLDVQEKAASA